MSCGLCYTTVSENMYNLSFLCTNFCFLFLFLFLFFGFFFFGVIFFKVQCCGVVYLEDWNLMSAMKTMGATIGFVFWYILAFLSLWYYHDGLEIWLCLALLAGQGSSLQCHLWAMSLYTDCHFPLL